MASPVEIFKSTSRSFQNIAGDVLASTLGVVFLIAAVSKAWSPESSVLFLRHLLDAVPSRELMLGIIGFEITLAAALMSGRWIPAVCLFTLGVLVVMTSALLWVAHFSSDVRSLSCGCFGDLISTSIQGSIARNGVMLAAAGAAALLYTHSRSRTELSRPLKAKDIAP